VERLDGLQRIVRPARALMVEVPLPLKRRPAMAESQSSPAPAPDLPATKARQGRMGRDVFWVLLISVVLAAVGLGVAWIWRAPQLAASEAHNGKQPAVAQSFNAQPPQPVESAAPPS
jgi:hypothetical protein